MTKTIEIKMKKYIVSTKSGQGIKVVFAACEEAACFACVSEDSHDKIYASTLLKADEIE